MKSDVALKVFGLERHEATQQNRAELDASNPILAPARLPAPSSFRSIPFFVATHPAFLIFQGGTAFVSPPVPGSIKNELP